MSSRARRTKRKQQLGLFTNIIFCLMTLAALTGCIILVLQNYNLKNETKETMIELEEAKQEQAKFIYTQKDLETQKLDAAKSAGEQERQALLEEIKTKMSSGESTAELLRGFYPENIVVYSDAKYYFFPILDSLKKHDYRYENFITKENKEIVYVDDTNEIHSKKGIDVSKHQGKIDWKKVADDGVEYAFIRAGYRGNSKGNLLEDECFQDNIKGALKNKIDVGVYFYTQAVNATEAEEEADMLLELIEPYDVNYPVVLDLEETGSDSARTADMTQEEYTKTALAFCNRIKAAGYTPMIYGNLKTFMIMLDMEQITEYDKWFAYYNTPVYFPYDFSIWQYSAKGKIAGISGDVDMNVCMKDYGED